jgi:hypothetical protein
MDYSQLAHNTIEFLKPYLAAEGGKLAKEGLSAAHERLFGWLKGRFTKPAQSGALAEAVQSPQDAGVLEALQVQIRRALEQQEEFRKELLERLPKEYHPQTTQTMNVTGHGNKSAQISGTGNSSSIQ